MLKTLFAPLQEFKQAAGLAALFAALEVVMEVLLPLVTARIIDRGISAGQMDQVVRYGVLMLVLAFLSLACGVGGSRYAARASAGYACNLRESLFAKVQTFSFSNIDKFSTAGLVTRMTTDVTNLQNAFMVILRIGIRSPLMLLASLALCIAISPQLSLIFLVAMVVLVVALGVIMAVTLPLFQKVFDRYDDLNASVQENVSAIRVVKAFVREEYENQKFQKAANALYRLFVKTEGILALNNPVMLLVVYGCMIALSWFGAQFVVAGNLTTGELTSLSTYIMGILMSLMMLSMIVVVVAMSLASARRIREVLTETPDLANAAAPVDTIPDGQIDFDHVSFKYNAKAEKNALSDITLHIPAGATVGIIGGTGAAKTTLVQLIPRLYDATEGTVRVGGRDVRGYDVNALRDAVGIVLQKNLLFSGTIRDNLKWGNPDATDDDLWAACRAARADEFLSRMPDGLDTDLGQGGCNVSGGQKQRLCIARTLLKHPKVLIFDDSTSAVDTATESGIRHALAGLGSVTKLIIAQRITSVQSADLIVILDDGRLHAVGTHDELLEKDTIYQEIYHSQMKGGDADGEAIRR